MSAHTERAAFAKARKHIMAFLDISAKEANALIKEENGGTPTTPREWVIAAQDLVQDLVDRTEPNDDGCYDS